MKMHNIQIITQMLKYLDKSKKSSLKDLGEILKIKKIYQNNKELFDKDNNIKNLKTIINFMELHDNILKEVYNLSDKLNEEINNSSTNYVNIISEVGNKEENLFINTIRINEIIKGEKKYNLNFKKKYELFIKKFKMFSDVDSFFLDSISDLENELEEDEKFKNLFFSKIDFLFKENLEQTKLTLNYMTKQSSVKYIYSYFEKNCNNPIYQENKDTVLEIIENIVSNENDLKKIKKLMEIK